MPRAFSARKPLERSKRPHNSAVCVNFKFDQASPPSISLLLAQPAPSPLLPSPYRQKAVLLIFIETFRRHVPRVLSSLFEFERKSGRGRALPLPILVWRDIRYSMKIP